VDIHPPPSSSSTNGPSGDQNRGQSNGGGDSDLYELIPSEKEFGTLGNSRPVLRGVSHIQSTTKKFLFTTRSICTEENVATRMDYIPSFCFHLSKKLNQMTKNVES
jgi:hypothetical protein